ncbi:hypothetical protein [Streptomyces beigongshangae]|uniref:hypothetical protein n=1 Tax=Streptomyces beigongshangae TaxID=2841597 RepID=UPI001C85606A|nr:hypothetical protein [Streptomyces sp. REN17]
MTTGNPAESRDRPVRTSARRPEAEELADRIVRTIAILDDLDLTGIPPAPVFLVTGHSPTGAPTGVRRSL